MTGEDFPTPTPELREKVLEEIPEELEDAVPESELLDSMDLSHRELLSGLAGLLADGRVTYLIWSSDGVKQRQWYRSDQEEPEEIGFPGESDSESEGGES